MTLVLLPGLEGTGNLFADFKRELPDTIQVVTASYPRDRFLSYPELVRWLDDVVPRDTLFVILAESFGTPLAVKFAATHPHNLIGVVLTAGFISDPSGIWRPLAKLLARPFLFRLGPTDALLERYFVGPDAPNSLKRAVLQSLRSTGAEILTMRFRAVLDCDARQEIRLMNVPLLYLQASNDRLVGRDSMDEIRRLHPSTVSNVISGPHLLLQREPAAVAARVLEFLKEKCQT